MKKGKENDCKNLNINFLGARDQAFTQHKEGRFHCEEKCCWSERLFQPSHWRKTSFFLWSLSLRATFSTRVFPVSTRVGKGKNHRFYAWRFVTLFPCQNVFKKNFFWQSNTVNFIRWSCCVSRIQCKSNKPISRPWSVQKLFTWICHFPTYHPNLQHFPTLVCMYGGHGGSRDYVASAGSSPSNNPIIKREHCCALFLCYLVADNLVKQQTRH